MKRLFFSVSILCMLVACAAPGPRVTSNVNPAVDISAVRTFGFMEPAGTDRANGVQTPLTLMLRGAVERELTSMGLSRADNPQMLVNFHVAFEERMDIRQVPTTSANTGWGYRRGRYRTWGGYETRVRQYTQGTLVIDMVDPSQNMLAWEGVAQQRLGRNMNQITQEQIDSVVAAILAEFKP